MEYFLVERVLLRERKSICATSCFLYSGLRAKDEASNEEVRRRVRTNSSFSTSLGKSCGWNAKDETAIRSKADCAPLVTPRRFRDFGGRPLHCLHRRTAEIGCPQHLAVPRRAPIRQPPQHPRTSSFLRRARTGSTVSAVNGRSSPRTWTTARRRRTVNQKPTEDRRPGEKYGASTRCGAWQGTTRPRGQSAESVP